MPHELFDKGVLNSACHQLAEQILRTSKGVSLDIVETLAEKFQKEALYHVDFIIGQEHDPNLLTKAIYYLIEAHAIPPMGTDVVWFQHMLTCLVELAIPNSGLTPNGAEFLKDVRIGVTISIKSAAE